MRRENSKDRLTGKPIPLKIWAFTVTLMLIFVGYPVHPKEFYKWVDEKGTVHFSEDESSVPEKYRDQVQKKSIKEEIKPLEEGLKKKQEGKEAKNQVRTRKGEETGVNQIEGDVIESIKKILSLWKDGKYEILYQHGDQKSRVSINKEDFEARMKKKGIGLASSWEMVRDIQVEVKSPTRADVTARIGFKSIRGGETKFRTETYPMSLEKGVWKINLLKILNTKI